MSVRSQMERWIELINARGIAGLGARESEEEKRKVEQRIVNEFASTASQLAGVEVSKIAKCAPPLPDFKCEVGKQSLHIELTEFIDPDLVERAKYIRRTPTEALHRSPLYFNASFEWFNKLLAKTIKTKDRRYANRNDKIDILLIWNEATELSIEDTGDWLKKFDVPTTDNIASIYFQSWYHPSYVARPTWSLKAHPLIGDITPVEN